MSEAIWLLNPDAERELAARASYAVRAAFIQRIAERRELFAQLSQGEPMFFVHENLREMAGRTALLWCPTGSVMKAAHEAGLVVPACPEVEVLRLTHNKSFLSTHLSELALPGRRVIRSQAEWDELRMRSEGDLRVKRFFGYAGKGQRVWKKVGGRDDLRWLQDSLRQGGFVAEPDWPDAPQRSMHGYVDRRGVIVGRSCLLETDRAGAPVCVRAAEMPDDSDAALRGLTERVGAVLSSVGYFGPFGIDCLLGVQGPRVIDLNPRFTLGWSQGMAEQRNEAISRVIAPVP